ncbi:MAG: glycoside hydrolase family 16 protein [Pseudomonadota bacterium]
MHAKRLMTFITLAAAIGCGPAFAAQPDGLFFDDFSHTDLQALGTQGWTVRSAAGHPGIAGAQWGPASIALVKDPQSPANQFLRLRASTDGTPAGTTQAQICHSRKYFEGTYAARIRFSDEPVAGEDGDVVVQTFYLVSPLKHDFDPEFSEVDWEYLPNGGWGDPTTRLYGITWQTVRIEPWQAHNQAHQEKRSVAGWHTLMLQVKDGKTRHWLNGVPVAEHGGRNYPVVPMSINFNLWFSPGGLLPVSNNSRIYEQDVDWVFHAKDQLLTPAQVDAQVGALRKNSQSFIDHVVPGTPPMASTCDF